MGVSVSTEIPGQWPLLAPLDKGPPWTKTPWTETQLDKDHLDRDPPGQRPPSGRRTLDRDRDSPVNRLTNASKNITLPQTSFTGGKNDKHQGVASPSFPCEWTFTVNNLTVPHFTEEEYFQL